MATYKWVHLQQFSPTLRARNDRHHHIDQARFYQVSTGNCYRPRRRVRICLGAISEDSESRDLVLRAKTYTADLNEMGMSLQTIRRNVAGAQNDLKSLKMYQDALDGSAPVGTDDIAQLKRILEKINNLRLNKAEEELFWARREGRVVSPIVDNVPDMNDDEKVEVGNFLTNITMYGVQGAAWNAIILLIVFLTLVTFVLR